MRRIGTKLLVVALMSLMATMQASLAQSGAPDASPASSGSVPKNTTPPQPSATQPVLPSAKATPPKPGSPVVEEIVETKRPTLDVRKRAATKGMPKRRHLARHHSFSPRLDRPALAGVELVAPLPLPHEPPHYTVPVPAFPLESVAAFYLTPPPPIVCHPTQRDRSAPDLRLYKEIPVECEPDNP